MIDTIYDYARPFDIMVGAWTGHSILYDNLGNYQISGPSIVWIYWIEPGKIMRYFQEDLSSLDDIAVLHEMHRDSFRDTVKTRAFDLEVNGKACKSYDKSDLKSDIKVEGTESRPGTYIFHLDFPKTEPTGAEPGSSGGNYYNNQYFTNPNERQIIGPYIARKEDGSLQSDVTSVVAQTFTRISYDIPKKFLEIEKHHINLLKEGQD